MANRNLLDFIFNYFLFVGARTGETSPFCRVEKLENYYVVFFLRMIDWAGTASERPLSRSKDVFLCINSILFVICFLVEFGSR